MVSRLLPCSHKALVQTTTMTLLARRRRRPAACRGSCRRSRRRCRWRCRRSAGSRIPNPSVSGPHPWRSPSGTRTRRGCWSGKRHRSPVITFTSWTLGHQDEFKLLSNCLLKDTTRRSKLTGDVLKSWCQWQFFLVLIRDPLTLQDSFDLMVEYNLTRTCITALMNMWKRLIQSTLHS